MVICVDFDGTMVTHNYPKMGDPVPGAIEWCKKLVESGCHLILWTMRSGRTLQEAVDFFNYHDIELLSVGVNPMQHRWTSSNKCFCHIYIDDRSLGCPLIEFEGSGGACVDWETVGPMTMQILEDLEREEMLERDAILQKLVRDFNQ